MWRGSGCSAIPYRLPPAACRITKSASRPASPSTSHTHQRSQYVIATRDGRTSETVQLYPAIATRARPSTTQSSPRSKTCTGAGRSGRSGAQYSLAARCDSAPAADRGRLGGDERRAGAAARGLDELLRFRSVSVAAWPAGGSRRIGQETVRTGGTMTPAACPLPAAEFLLTFALPARLTPGTSSSAPRRARRSPKTRCCSEA
jgi:hypothetical protein